MNQRRIQTDTVNNRAELEPDPSKNLTINQEAGLLKDAFLVSSSIEILSTPSARVQSIQPSEQKLLKKLSIFLEELRKAEDYLASNNSGFMLQPEGVDLILQVRAQENSFSGQDLSNAQEFLIRIVENDEIATIDRLQDQIDHLVDLLRMILVGVKDRLSYADHSQARYL